MGPSGASLHGGRRSDALRRQSLGSHKRGGRMNGPGTHTRMQDSCRVLHGSVLADPSSKYGGDADGLPRRSSEK